MLGIAPATLRSWERRYGVPSPDRTTSAYRLYSPADIDLLREMQRLCAEGIPARDAADSVREHVKVAAPTAETTSSENDDVARMTLLLDAIRSRGTARLDLELARTMLVGSPDVVFERIIGPLLVEVGVLWSEGELTVWHEHLVAERVGTLLRSQLRLFEADADRPLALLACFPDEEHALGQVGAAFGFLAAGYRVVLLGARTPPAALRDANVALEPAVIGLSTVFPQPLPRMAHQVAAYAEAANSTPWIVGGPSVGPIAELVASYGGFVATGPISAWKNRVSAWCRTARTRSRKHDRDGGPA